MRILSKIAFFLIFCFFTISRVYAQNTSDTLVYQTGIVNLTNYIKTFKDEQANMPFKTILNEAEFESSKGIVPNFGTTKANCWIKFSLKNESTHHLLVELNYPILDQVSFYKVVNGKLVYLENTGEMYPFHSRGTNNVSYVFPVRLSIHQTADFYLKLKSGEQIIAPLSISTDQSLTQNKVNKFLIFGLYTGIFIAMFLYNIFLYISTKDKSYLPYVFYIFFVGLTQATLNGYSFKYLWPDYPVLAIRATHFCGALSGIVTIWFVKNFLSTKVNTPHFHKLLSFFLFIYVISIFFTIFNQLQIAYTLINITAGTGSLILLFTSYYIYRKKRYRPALFFMIAWSVFIISILIFVLKDFGILPYNNLTISGLQIGSAIEVLLLSFALADKINIFKAEREKSREETLIVLKENERIIREQNVILEAKVEERTLELSEANTELNDTLIDLKETQSQLVDAEKMASLGQLTAGIAHEINNPINFVTSNVNPLKRNIDLLIDTIEKLEKISLSDLDENDKTQQIELIKEEIEYDYLKIEIDHLIKGIREGATRTAEIVKGLKIFSRLDQDDLQLADVNEGLKSTLIITNNQLGKIIVIKDFDDLPLIECYPGKLNQVFLNIISNAIYAITKKFKDKHGGILEIKTYFNDDFTYVSLKDNGCGMNDNTIRKIFEPFFTTKDVGEGTGLGMSIAYNIIKKHQGIISVESEEEIGTTFLIKLPLKLKN